MWEQSLTAGLGSTALTKLRAALRFHALKNEYLFSVMNTSGSQYNAYPFSNIA